MLELTQKFIGNGSDGTPPGDCTRTAIASLLDLDVELVPHFALFSDYRWTNALFAWIDSCGYELTVYTDDKSLRDWWDDLGANTGELKAAPSDETLIASGDSPNGSWGHVVLWRNGALEWDVHPNPRGLASEPWEFWRIKK